jgi:transposase InsO family protein
MPWKERTALEDRKSFVLEWGNGGDSFAELCRQHGVSRVTGYKWVKRFEAGGEAALLEESRAPHRIAGAMSAAVADRIVNLRHHHPRWGPRKLRAYLIAREPKKPWPAPSSIGQLLVREGLVIHRRVRHRTPPYSEPLAHADAPNRVWCTDYKGWFLCGNGERCDPLTVSDAFSRFLLRCRAVPKTDVRHTRAVFEAVFRESGLPDRMRHDNGSPFASRAPGGLSRLSLWWVQLGIVPERIEPGCPEQNGRHERLHQTLKQETADPPRATLRQQQKAFGSFERVYNEERPHEALGYRTPASVYHPSPRLYPSRLPEPQCPAGVQLRKISQQGSLKWKTERTFLSEVFARQVVGLLEVEEDFFEVYYGPVLLGWFDGSAHVFAADRPPSRRSHRDTQGHDEQD